MQLSNLQRRLINEYQGNVPIASRPFRIMAKHLDVSEQEVMEAIQHLLESKALSRFGPIYDAVRLGGELTLAAMIVPEESFDDIAEMVNQHPEVAHNYRRKHQLNMWFVIATSEQKKIADVIARIEQQTGIRVFNFPKQQEFYLGLWLKINQQNQPETVAVPEHCIQSRANRVINKDPLMLDIIQQTQSGFTISATPYRTLADKLAQSESKIMQKFEQMKEQGIIRRIGAIPNHYQLGLKYNAMTVWQIREPDLTTAGKQLARLDFVSHCYQRPQYPPFWNYNLFAMVHGYQQSQIDDKIQTMKSLLADSCIQQDTLISSAILKKTGLRLAA